MEYSEMEEYGLWNQAHHNLNSVSTTKEFCNWINHLIVLSHMGSHLPLRVTSEKIKFLKKQETNYTEAFPGALHIEIENKF